MNKRACAFLISQRRRAQKLVRILAKKSNIELQHNDTINGSARKQKEGNMQT